MDEGVLPSPDDRDDLGALIRALAERDTLLFDPVTDGGVQACGKCGTCGVSATPRGRPPDTEANIQIIRDRISQNPEVLRDLNERLNIRTPDLPANRPGGGG